MLWSGDALRGSWYHLCGSDNATGNAPLLLGRITGVGDSLRITLLLFGNAVCGSKPYGLDPGAGPRATRVLGVAVFGSEP